MQKVAINGLGRIGRAALKIVMDNPKLDLVAVNDIVPADNLAYLLRYDTVYGRYEKEVKAESDSLVIDGKKIPVCSEKDPSQLPWGDMGVDTVFECTGIFTKGPDMQKHLDAGAKRVILSAPAKDDTDTVVHAVNSSDSEKFSTASCTTNCITPVVESMDRNIGVEKAIMTTVHAYTANQAIVDVPSSNLRRGRAGACNFVPTSTGAAKATAKVLTQFKGKFDGIAIRGPVPVGSIADVVFLTSRDTTREEINEMLTKEANTKYSGIMGVCEEEIVSSDIIADPRASIVDLTMTQVVDGNLVKVLAWYDNEWGYANQMVREAAC
ncbi:MAG: type I glyceraldehyde-3-phosphate dehydrogenase, partial [Lentisphaeria bacterium]